MSLPIALQLYTVREPLAQDYEGTLEKLAGFGYRHVEMAGVRDRTPEQVRAILDRLGLTAVSAHWPLDYYGGDLTQAIEQAKVFGYNHLCCPFLVPERRTPAGYAETRDILLRAADKLADAGLTLCYHNHNFEFETLDDGTRGIDILFEGTTLNSELDVYWAQKGGDDPLDWMHKLAGRVPLLHIKDMDDSPQRDFTEIGRGIVDIPAVVENATKVGAKYLIIEQDANFTDNPLDSARVCLENLTRITGEAAAATS